MKKNLSTLIFTAAVLTLGAAAYAQTPLIANVPFSFHVNGAVLPAGNYQIAPATNGTMAALKVADQDTRRSAYVLADSAYEATTGNPRLIFRCGDVSGCALIQVWGDSGYGWAFHAPKLSPAEKERLAVVPLRRTDAE